MAWTDATRTGMVRRIADAAGLKIVGAGAPGRGQSSAVADALGAPVADDLRAALAANEARVFLIASPGQFGLGEPADSAAVQAAHARGARVVLLEPRPTSAAELLALETGGGATSLGTLVPMGRSSPAMAEAIEILAHAGPARCASIECLGGAEHGSLGARLVSAVDLAVAFMGEPELVEASCVPARGAGGVHTVPGESLRDLHGDLTAHLRYADGRSLVLIASDDASAWRVSATILTGAGRIDARDGHASWLAKDGTPAEGVSAKARSRAGEADDAYVGDCARAITRLLDPHQADPAPIDVATILSIAQAALLSARTGQGESPGTIRRVLATGR